MKHIGLVELVEAFTNLENFTWVRNTTRSQFLGQFSERVEEVKRCNGELSDFYLALRLLKCSNLHKLNHCLDNLNIAKLTYSEVRKLVCKVYKDTDGDDTDSEDNHQKTDIQVTAINEAKTDRVTTGSQKHRGWSGESNTNLTIGKDPAAKKRLPLQKGKTLNTYNSCTSKPDVASSVNSLRHGRNPSNKNGVISKCVICRSINHWSMDCPDQSIHQVDIDTKQLERLHEDTCNNGYSSTIFSTDVSKSVCGIDWLISYIESLSPREKSMVVDSPSDIVFNFRKTGQVTSLKSVTIPLIMDRQLKKVASVKVEVVEMNIPLLLSRATLISARTRINPLTNTVEFSGVRRYVNLHESGYYFMLSHNRTTITQSPG